MPKIVRSISSPNDLWHQEEVDFQFGEGPLSDEHNADDKEFRELLARTEKQGVLDRLQNIEDRARQVFTDHGLPIQPGVYFEPHNGPREFISTDCKNCLPLELFARAESGEGAIIIWPSFQTIDKLTPPDFARTVLILVRELAEELKHGRDPLRIARLSLELLHPYHCLVTEDSDLAKSAVSGMKAQNSTRSAAEANKRAARARLPLIDQLAKQVLSEPGNSKKKSAKAIAELIKGRVESALLSAGMRIIHKDQLERDLRALGYKK